MLGGPNYETVAELKMLQLCGVDAVGKGLTKFIVIRLNMEEEKYSLQILSWSLSKQNHPLSHLSIVNAEGIKYVLGAQKTTFPPGRDAIIPYVHFRDEYDPGSTDRSTL